MNLKSQIIKNKKQIESVISGFIQFGINDDPETIYLDNSFFKRITKRYQKAARLFDIKPKWALHNTAQKTQKHYNEKQPLFLNRWAKIFELLTDDEKMMAIHLLFMTTFFDEKCCRMILDYTRSTNNRHYRYWNTLNIEKETFYTQRGLYYEYYRDRKELLKQISEEMGLSIPTIKKQENDKSQRLCIITYLLSDSIFNSMQRVAAMTANRLRKHYSDVLVVNLDSFSVGNDDGHRFGRMINYPESISMREGIKELFNDGVRIHYSFGNNYTERYQDAINAIYEYNPSIIIDITDEFSPISYCYSKDYRTVYLPLRYGPSSSYFTSILMPHHIVEIWRTKYDFWNNEEIVDWCLPEYVPPETEPYTRGELGFGEEAFIVVSVGGHEKLCNKEFAENFIPLLQKYERIQWLIVGGNAPQFLHDEHPDLFESRRIIERGFETKLKALYDICNVHLRFNTVGGGGATAIAAMSGLPIAMTTYVCDATNWLGTDYSSCENYEQLVRYIEKLFLDPKAYETAQRKTKELISKVLDTEDKWDELYSLLSKKQIAGV